jgi:hypothetical protein
MLKRWWFWAAAMLLAAGTSLCVSVGMLHEPFNKANFEQIEIGMTEKEVEALLGIPPGDYSMFAVDGRPRFVFWTLFCPERNCYAEGWIGDHGSIIVIFDEKEKRVADKHFLQPGNNTRVSTTTQIKYTMRRVWQRITGHVAD